MGTTPVSLVSVTHHKGVNALAPEQTIVFGSQLTIAFGQNAAGKSGYTRILRKACRSRFTEDILGNVLAGGAPLKAEATIRYRVGSVEHDTKWGPDTAPTGALASVSVFDSQCAPVYLRDKTDVAFRPFSLDVFVKLSTVCAEVKKRLEADQMALSIAVLLPRVDDGTRVAAVLASLTSLTRSDDVRALATLSDSDERRLKALRDHERDLQASDPKKTAQELELKAARLDLLANHVGVLIQVLGDAGIESLQSSAAARAAAQAALEHLRRTVFTADVLPGTGGDAWRKLWDAAEDFSRTAYPGKPFPLMTADAKCVFCQQPIGADAHTHVAHFAQLVTSTALADVRAAEAAHKARLDALRTVPIQRDDVALALNELDVEDSRLGDACPPGAGRRHATSAVDPGFGITSTARHRW